MKFLPHVISLLVCFVSVAFGEDLDTDVAKLATDLSAATSKASIKKISVLDFTDLQGNSSEFGRYVAEQLSILLANSSKDFSVMNRANLRNILEEHKLTASGLVNPENSKKLGQFSGVDAIVMGSITPFGEKLNITAQILSTETAQVVGGTTVKITRTKEINDLLETPTPKADTVGTADSKKPGKDFESPNTTVIYDELSIELLSFRFTTNNTVLLTLKFENRDKSGPIKMGLNCDNSRTRVALMDENGAEFPITGVTGINVPGSDMVENFYQRVHDDLNNQYQQAYIASRINRMYDLDAGQTTMVTLTFATGGRPVGSRIRLYGEIALAVIRRNTVQKFKLINLFIDEIHPKG